MFSTGYHATGYHGVPYYTKLSDAPVSVLGDRWTYFTLIQEAREILTDEGPELFRYPDEMLINSLNRGLHELSKKRPDAYYDLFDANDLNVPQVTVESPPPQSTTFWGEEFILDLRFYPPLVTYVVGMAYASEDPYMEDGRAQAQLDMFHRHVLSV